MSGAAVSEKRGKGIALRGNDIDTDRIIPARYLASITFAGLEDGLFRDVRFAADGEHQDHPFNEARYRGASILAVNRNFGCGSSREHAPQALVRWGIRALVGESFGEIFFGNCTALGMPCLAVAAEDLEWLMKSTAQHPDREILVDVENREVRVAERIIPAMIPEDHRNQLLTGTWNATVVLQEAGEEIERVAKSLPYVTGY